jgi:hypothetical protein
MPVLLEIVGVYDADGGFRGELAYVWGKAIGSAHCALCDITHGTVAVTGRRAWKQMCLELPLRAVHRDERDPELRAATGDELPCVVARTDEGIVRLLSPADLEACGGHLPTFDGRLRAALEAIGLAVG